MTPVAVSFCWPHLRRLCLSVSINVFEGISVHTNQMHYTVHVRIVFALPAVGPNDDSPLVHSNISGYLWPPRDIFWSHDLTFTVKDIHIMKLTSKSTVWAAPLDGLAQGHLCGDSKWGASAALSFSSLRLAWTWFTWLDSSQTCHKSGNVRLDKIKKRLDLHIQKCVEQLLIFLSMDILTAANHVVLASGKGVLDSANQQADSRYLRLLLYIQI